MEKSGILILFVCIFLFSLYFGIVYRKIYDNLRSFCEAFGLCPVCTGADEASDVEVGKHNSTSGNETSMLSSSNSSSNLGDNAPGETSFLLGVRAGAGIDSCGNSYSGMSCKSPTDRGEVFLLLACASCYVPMLLSSWGSPDGSPEVDSRSASGNVGLTVPVFLKFFCELCLFVVYALSLFNSYRLHFDFIRHSRNK